MWTALRQPFSLLWLTELEESHGANSDDWITVFQVLGVSATGDVVVRQRLRRGKVLQFFANTTG